MFRPVGDRRRRRAFARAASGAVSDRHRVGCVAVARDRGGRRVDAEDERRGSSDHHCTFPEPELTVRECLSLYAGYYVAPRGLDDTLAQVGLAELGWRRCAQLSGGQRRRLDVALALIGDPELLFLDEPTTGFDPAARRAMWDLVESLRSGGTTIVLTTHYMDEAERLADRIAVIALGEIVATGTPGSLGSRTQLAAEISFSVPAGIELSQLPVGIDETGIGRRGEVRVATDDPVSALFSLTRWALEHDHQLPDLELRRPTLEDVYLHLTATAADQRAAQ
jgi:ABC-2 type transport system ATP-binding protein